MNQCLIVGYSLYHPKCRDISGYISVALGDIGPKFGTRNKCKMCMLNMKNYLRALNIKACFFFVSVIYFGLKKVPKVMFLN